MSRLSRRRAGALAPHNHIADLGNMDLCVTHGRFHFRIIVHSRVPGDRAGTGTTRRGYLCPQRCFIVVPRGIEVHIPTDLLGMTLGHYDDTRSDGNDEAAVASFLQQSQEAGAEGRFLRGG